MTKRTVRVSREQLEYLRSASFLPAKVAEILPADEGPVGNAASIVVSPELAEEVRSALTTRLAVAGFDDRYEPTLEGRLLEDLIDRFCLG